MQYMTREDIDLLIASKMKQVFLWMFLGVFVTGGVIAISTFSYLAFGNPTLLNFAITLRFPIMIGTFGIVFFLSSKIYSLNPTTAKGMFLLYAALLGFLLSGLSVYYGADLVIYAFLGAVVLFGTMAAYGYTTNEDLTKFGGLLKGTLIAVIVISLFNFFMRSEAIYYIMSYVGLILFVALTAYDVQKIKNNFVIIYTEYPESAESLSESAAIIGALSIYLDFINIFLYLLRIFGRRR